MIRILIADDHPAMLAGLTAVLRAEPGLAPVGAVASADEVEEAATRMRPDVVLLDYHLPGVDGLRACRRLKRDPHGPAVLLYSAYADASLAIPAILAGADGILNKSTPAPQLYDALRSVARGDRLLPPVPRELLHASSARLDEEDLPILGMALDGTAADEIAQTLRMTGEQLAARLDVMIERLRVELPAPA
jgi:DNA-binding NarL/FixJ family response regulator